MVLALKIAGFGGKSVRWSAKKVWAAIAALALLAWAERTAPWFITALAVVFTYAAGRHSTGLIVLIICLTIALRAKSKVKTLVATRTLVVGVLFFVAFYAFVEACQAGALGLFLGVLSIGAGFHFGNNKVFGKKPRK